MSIRIIKSTEYVGECNDDGISVPESAFLVHARDAYLNTQRRAKALNATTTRPARMLIVVEQEVIIDGD